MDSPRALGTTPALPEAESFGCGPRRSLLGGGGPRAPPMRLPSLRSCSPEQRRTRPRLLAGVTGGEAGMVGAAVFVVEASGRTRSYEHSKIGELVKSLWPGEQHPDGLCRTLRFLSDSAKQDFLLRPTKRGILVRADFARALVEPDRAVFLSARGSFFESFKEELLEHIGGSGRPFTEESTFSHFVVESIVCATVTMLTLRLQVLKPVAENILGHIRLQSPDSILQLYPVKLALSSFVEQVRPLVQGLNGMLQDLGTEGVATTGCMPSRQISGAGDGLPVGLEDCLHNWVHSAEEVMADACETNVTIEDTMRFLEASMSCTRNRLLMFEVWTMIATVAMGLGAMISGIFGMNLKSGLEDAPDKFNQVVMLIMTLAFLIITVSVGFIVFSQRTYHYHAARFGNNRFFKSIADDEYVLSLCSGPDGSVLPEVQRDHVLQELRCPALPLSEPLAAQQRQASGGSSARMSMSFGSGPSQAQQQG